MSVYTPQNRLKSVFGVNTLYFLVNMVILSISESKKEYYSNVMCPLVVTLSFNGF